mmetsp:Transcript_26670/g.88540  ORF Transcript_26670/g.88540 Transcript_26670/m.88540 type:complete len:275 (-) Transcript_26670:19-843(-)
MMVSVTTVLPFASLRTPSSCLSVLRSTGAAAACFPTANALAPPVLLPARGGEAPVRAICLCRTTALHSEVEPSAPTVSLRNRICVSTAVNPARAVEDEDGALAATSADARAPGPAPARRADNGEPRSASTRALSSSASLCKRRASSMSPRVSGRCRARGGVATAASTLGAHTRGGDDEADAAARGLATAAAAAAAGLAAAAGRLSGLPPAGTPATASRRRPGPMPAAVAPTGAALRFAAAGFAREAGLLRAGLAAIPVGSRREHHKKAVGLFVA